MVKLAIGKFKCSHCEHEFEEEIGPVRCPQCGHIYVTWLNYEELRLARFPTRN